MGITMLPGKFNKLTSAYLKKYFTKKNLPFQEWVIHKNGITHVIDNQHVIKSILTARPDEQLLIAECLEQLDANNSDINRFLKHLVIEGRIGHEFNTVA
ncbi:MAG: hypothetical protein OQL06_09165 [Gammaproteobacteria bacterium]|nr:hypothetical protein [Gammaproteobacteria bacterium]